MKESKIKFFKRTASLGRRETFSEIVSRGRKVRASYPNARVYIFAQELACLYFGGANPLLDKNPRTYRKSQLSNMAEYEGIIFLCNDYIPINIGEY